MKSKILIVNKYHFMSGGAERYFLKFMDALRDRGIEPIPFSVNYSRTLETPYRKYFIEPIVQDGQVKIQNMKPSLSQQLKLAGRALYCYEAKKSIRKIYEDHRPDLAYFLNFNNHISPSAIDACTELGIPVVMRMSDYNLSCASNMYYRDNKPCLDCRSGMHHALFHRCVHGSFARTAAQVFANSLHRFTKVYHKVSAFIAPTEFMRQDLISLGFPSERIFQVNTFVKPCTEPASLDEDNPYILYVGRLVKYKGVEAAIRAFSKLPKSLSVSLRLVGDEKDEEAARFRKLAEDLGETRIQFLPFEKDPKKVHDQMHRALFVLVPSECYDNLPNTILEAFACGRPVIATRMGSFVDIVQDQKLGLLFEYGNADDFSNKMLRLIKNPSERELLGRQARLAALQDYAEEEHMNKILEIFRQLIQQKIHGTRDLFLSHSPTGVIGDNG